MKRVIGLGGIFFKAEDPQKLYAWYERHLGIEFRPGEGASFPWRRKDDPPAETFTRVVDFSARHHLLQSQPGALHDQLPG